MRKRDGFTLVEASVAMSIFVIGIALIVGGYMYLQKNSQEQLIQDTLELDLNMAVQRLQAEMRLSDLSEMTYYPSSSRRYTAVSFPLLDRENPKSTNWASTVIYHTTPEKDRLLRTEIDGFLEDVGARQEQLKTVVEAGKGGDDAKTTTLFEHILDWSIIPLGSSYDGYSESEQIDLQASLGRGIVDPGENTLKFTVTGAGAGGGYKIGLDTLRASTSGLLREAETQSNFVSGSTGWTVEYNASALWSGYHHLSFDATATGQTYSVPFYNDLWEDTNFDLSGNIKSNVIVSLDPPDLVLHLEGDTTNWMASAQTGDDIGGTSSGVAFRGAALRTIIRGASMANGSLLGHNGDLCRVAFAAGSNDLHIVEAYIDEVVDSYDVVPDTVGRPTKIRFPSESERTISAGNTVWSDYLDFSIKYDKSYAVTLSIADDGACQPKIWVDQNGVTGTYVITNTVSSADLVSTDWNADHILAATVAVEMLHTMYPSNGVYISPAIDTKMESLDYEISWNANDDSSVEVYVRSGSVPEMNDAWSKVSQEDNVSSAERYVQYKAVLSSDGFYTPKLQDVTLEWDGETKIVEVGGAFINGPNYGQFEVELNDEPLTSPLRVSLVVKKEIRSMNNETKTIEAREVFELAPRNTRRIR